MEIYNIEEGSAQSLHMPDLLSIHVLALRRQLSFIPVTPVMVTFALLWPHCRSVPTYPNTFRDVTNNLFLKACQAQGEKSPIKR
jgi:hypothetical protein